MSRKNEPAVVRGKRNKKLVKVAISFDAHRSGYRGIEPLCLQIRVPVDPKLFYVGVTPKGIKELEVDLLGLAQKTYPDDEIEEVYLRGFMPLVHDEDEFPVQTPYREDVKAEWDQL